MIDTAYENSVVINREQANVSKSFKSKKNFLTEKKALEMLKGQNISPYILAVKPNCLTLQYIEGKDLNEDNFRENNIISAAAKTIHKLHSVCNCKDIGDLLTAPPTQQKSWQEHLLKKTKARIDEIKDCPIQLEKIYERIYSISNPMKLSLLHHDLKPSNMIFYQKEVYLIDFEKASIGDHLHDLGKMKWRCFSKHPSKWNNFLNFYFSLERTEHYRKDSLELIDLYEALHCIGALAYWYSYRIPHYQKHALSAEKKLKDYLFK